jgi:beta-galactosidase
VTLERRTIDFGRSWRFALANRDAATDPGGRYAHAAEPGFDDSGWRTVDVPHDWSIELAPRRAPDTDPGSGFFHGGLGWYRKTFTLPPWLRGRRVSIEFDGVYMDSSVYLNGALVGGHPYGYTGFQVDLTDRVHTDGVTADVIAVRIRNQLPNSRWYSGSGLYRDVRLVVTDPVHVARWGTFVSTPDPASTGGAGAGGPGGLGGPGRAPVRIRTDVANESGAPVEVGIVSSIIDPAGRQVARGAGTATVPPAGYTHTGTVEVPAPLLWSPEHPYLYTLRTELTVAGRVVDAYPTTFGIRYPRFDPALGFSLNGAHLKLRGVNLHHDQGALGSAVHADAIGRQLRLMRGMGVNAIRTAHNPPAPQTIRLCERLGLLLVVEAFDCWRTGKNRYDYGRFFDEHSDADVAEMVHAAKNSPAVIAWSIGNEILDSTVAGVAMAARLAAGVRAIDHTRPVVIGSDKHRHVPEPGSPADLMLAGLDGLGLNYNTAASLDALHGRYPNLFLFESESSSQTSTRGVYQEPGHLNTAENHTPGRRATSSYDNNLEPWTASGEYVLKKDRDRGFFAGQFLWVGMDYIGEPTPYSVFPVKASFFGAVDTAGLPKDAYHLYRSQWTSEPMVHLVPMDWTDHEPGERVEIRAYSNVDSVELFLNGRSLGVRAFDRKTTTDGVGYLETTEPTHDDRTVAGGPFPGSYTSPNGSAGKLHLSWSVPFAPGTLTAVARRRDGASALEAARDELRTAGPAHAVRLTPERKVMGTDRRSLAYLIAEIVDADGVVLPNACRPVTFRVEPPDTGAPLGVLAGLDNGRQESAEPYQGTDTRDTFNGRALAIVRSTGRSGPITLSATSPGLLPATATVHATAAAPAALPDPGDPAALPDPGEAAVEALADPGEAAVEGSAVEGPAVGSSTDGLVGLDPVVRRFALGDPVRLPEAVNAVHADGTQRALPVRWAPPPEEMRHRVGGYRIAGAVPGTATPALAMVTVYAPATLETWSTAVPVGTPPILPATLRLVDSDGVDRRVPVEWDAVPPGSWAAPGRFTVNGTGSAAGTGGPVAVATVRVTGDAWFGVNLAAAGGPAHPVADASFSGAPDALPAAMLDAAGGTPEVPAPGGWSNAFRKAGTDLLPAFGAARPCDWVSVSWPHPQRFGAVTVGFTVDDRHALPATIAVTYRDGERRVPVRGLSVDWAGTVATLTFEPVGTIEVRLALTSGHPGASNGFLRIGRLTVTGDAVAYQATAALAALRVDGRPVPGFDPSIEDYEVPAGGPGTPEIVARAAANGRLLIVPPPAVPGTAAVTVTAEDGLARRTYRIRLTGPAA